jgi:hypothetical protein
MCVTHMVEIRNGYKHLFGTTEGKGQILRARSKGRMILNWTLRKCDVTVCTVFIKIRIAISGERLWTRL